ncbi:aspartic peptidase domain-containing protein [Xylaria sp. CBS 124048]|nr:aspartic peptidase domain-containing protein [Xylaria sp. CBS 124048]
MAMTTVSGLATGFLLASVASAQVQWNIEKRANPVPRLGRRTGGSISETILNEQSLGGYFMTVTVGSPPQNITLQLDTGSSDVWVPAVNAPICEEDVQQDGGCFLGAFNKAQSDTNTIVNNEFDITYVDGSHSRGDYMTDTFSLGDVTLQNLTMGLGEDTTIPYGLCGVGYALNEASVAQTGQVYNNLPIVMRDEGHIATNAYSVWLNDLDSSKGNILFGAIDTAKFSGSLMTVNVQKDPRSDKFTAFVVELTSVDAHSSSGDDALSSQAFPIPAVLDSGTTFTYLPQDLAEQVWKEVGAVFETISSQIPPAPLVPCNLANKDGYFAFGFGGKGGPVIQVALNELVFPIFDGRPVPFPSGPNKGQDICLFGIQNTTSSPFLLGDTFLRSAYLVYDLENNEIGLAPTNFNATATNVVPFPSQGAKIPSSTPAPNQGSVESSNSDNGPGFSALGGFTLGSGSSSLMAFDFTALAVLGGSLSLMVLGGGMFALF